jgi:hypothetical protein
MASARLALNVCIATLLGLVPSCADRPGTEQRLQEELLTELDTFPAPSHLDLIHTEEAGPSSSCRAGDCPRVSRFFVTDHGLAGTCRDVESASEGWGLMSMHWTGDDGAFNACLGAGQDNGRGISLSVFDAERLPVLTSAEIDIAELRGYRSGVLIVLSVAP